MKRARDPDLIREAMQQRTGVSLRELGRLAETTDGTISFILSGRTTSPEIARRIARSLKRPVSELFEDAVTSDELDSNQQDAVA